MMVQVKKAGGAEVWLLVKVCDVVHVDLVCVAVDVCERYVHI